MGRLTKVLQSIVDAKTFASKKLRAAVLQVAPAWTLRGQLALALPLTIFLSFVVSVGPATQASIFSVVGTDAPDLHRAAVESGVPPLNDALAWLSLGFHWLNLLMGATIALLALRQLTLQGVLIAIAIWSGVVLTAADLLAALVLRNFSIQQQIANVMANAIGGVVIATLAAGALVVFRYVTRWVAQRPTVAFSLGVLSAATLGLATSASTFFALRYVYQPLPAQFAVVLTPSSEGMLDGELPPAEWTLGERRPFDLLPSLPTRGGISMDGADSELRVRWTRERVGREYDIGVRFVGDCVHDSVEALPSGPDVLVARSVTSASLFFDGGGHRFQVAPADQRSFAFLPSDPTYFWLDLEDDGSGVRLMYFTSPEDRVSMTSTGPISYIAGVHLLAHVEEAFLPVRRSISLQIDGREWIATFNRGSLVRSGQSAVCHALTAAISERNAAEIIVPIDDEIQVGVVITLTPSADEPRVFSSSHETRLAFEGAHGWTSFTEISTEELERSSQGRLSFLRLGGGLSDLEVNGSAISVGPRDKVVAIGDFIASYGAGGRLYISGEATSLWKNTSRLNPTRAELLPAEVSLALLTAVLAIIGYLLRMGWRALVPMLRWSPPALLP